MILYSNRINKIYKSIRNNIQMSKKFSQRQAFKINHQFPNKISKKIQLKKK